MPLKRDVSLEVSLFEMDGGRKGVCVEEGRVRLELGFGHATQGSTSPADFSLSTSHQRHEHHLYMEAFTTATGLFREPYDCAETPVSRKSQHFGRPDTHGDPVRPR